MGIRPFRPADTAAVDALLDSDADALRRHQLRALHGPNRDDPRWRRTVVAERDGAVVGAGTVLASRLHAGALAAHVEVAAGWRRRRIGSQLVAELVRLRRDPTPLSAKCRESDSAAIGFAARHGLRTVMRTHGRWVEPGGPAAAAWIAGTTDPPGYRFTDLTGVPDGQVVEAWTDMYVWLHEHWAPVRSREVALDLFTAEPPGVLARGTSHAAWRDGRIVALAACGPFGGHHMIVAETCHPDVPDGRAVVAALVARCIRAAARSGVGTLTFDGDESMPNLTPLLATLPGVPEDVLHFMVGDPAPT